MMEEFYCMSPLMVLSGLAILLNLVMTVHLYQAENPCVGVGLLFKLIGICNVACGVFISFRVVLKAVSTPLPLKWFVSAALMTSLCLQLCINVSLAFARLQVVKDPMTYRTREAKKSLEKKLSIAASLLSLIIGTSCSAMRFYFKKPAFNVIPLAVLRIIAYLSLCILYCKLYFSMKRQAQAIEPNINEPGQRSSNEVVKRRRKQLKHKRKFFIGITSSFFVLNLPSIIVYFTTDELPPCTSVQRMIYIVPIGLSFFNMIFDVLWYVYMYKRSKSYVNVVSVIVK